MKWANGRYLLAFLMIVGLGCPTQKQPGGRGPLRPDVIGSTASAIPAEGDGLAFRLEEGPPPAHRRPAARTAPKVELLSEADTKKIFQRLPPIDAQATDQTDFALRDRSLPPPRTAKKITTPFPPPERPDAHAPRPETGPVEVLRFAPEGDVPIAPHLSITFNQPMVEVTAVDELVAQGVPVKLTPQPPGAWRWLGTRTLVFEPKPRFPMATTYTVEIPAGTKSATGGALKKAKSWTFQTPPPVLQTGYPHDGPHGLEPVIFVAFDQAIDPAAVLATIRVSAGGRTFAARPATAGEIEADRVVKALVARADADGQSGRWLAFKPTEALPKNTRVSVTVGPGTPSAEGPRRTERAQSFEFYTYGPLEIVETRCGWGDECPPYAPWSIRMSNPIDTKAFQRQLVAIEPDLASAKIDVNHDWIVIRGRSKGRTSYAVRLDAELRDTFGQTLGSERKVAFKVTDAPKRLWASGGPFVVLDPQGGGTFSVFSTNHRNLKVQVYAVEPEHFDAFGHAVREWQRDRKRVGMPGRRVVDTVIDVKGDPDEMVETRIDLSPALESGLGHAIVVVEPTRQPSHRWEQQAVHAWTQSTRIGLAAFTDGSEMVAWASDLATGAPQGGVELTIAPWKHASAATRSDGLATLPLASAPSRKPKSLPMLVATRGADVAILPERVDFRDGWTGWVRTEQGDGLRWFVFDDRGMYRPGEKVHVKGWIRRYGLGEGGTVGALDGAVSRIGYKVVDSQGNEILKGKADVDALGGWHATFELPPTVNLGYAQIRLEADVTHGMPGREQSHVFQVQEFRRPEFEVEVTTSEGPHLVGTHVDATVTARYYAGGGLPGADTTWTVSSAPGTFTPPGHGEWTFGVWTPWWWNGHDGEGGASLRRHETYPAKTDASGAHHLRIHLDDAKPARTYVLTAQASVVDVNRQAWAGTSQLVIHPAAAYVGLKLEKLFVNEGEPIHIDAIVTDLDGNKLAGRPITMRAVRLDWTLEDGVHKQVEEKPQDCAITSAAAPARCTFRPEQGGTYKVRAFTEDEKGRKNLTELTFWVAGADRLPPARGVEQERVTIVPDRKTYRADETARLLVQAPFAPAEGLVTYRRSGIVKTERFTMKDPSHTLSIPIRGEYAPNLWVQVDLVGVAPRVDDQGAPDPRLPARPAFATGLINLEVPPAEHRLAVSVTPRDKSLEPGGETTVDVELRDAGGRPVAGGQVAVVVVDEAVLALSGHRTPDPLAWFYATREAGARDAHARAYVVLARPDGLAAGGGAGGGGGDGDAAPDRADAAHRGRVVAAKPAPAPARNAAEEAKQDAAPGAASPGPTPTIAVRTNFDALAVFAPAVPTGAGGRAQVKVKLPDNLTRYRVMVAAVAGGRQFGSGEAAITARLPLMARPSPPRFLNFGDRFELPVVLQNQTDRPMTVDVAARAANATMIDAAGRRVVVPANDRVELRFAATTVRAGAARFQVGAVSGRHSDAAEVKLPVWTPATTEAFATYGEIDQGAIVQPVKAPASVVTQFGGLEITTSSTALSSLTDAFLYLVSYPFECSEQVASRLLAVAALRDVLAAFKAEGLPPEAEILAAVERDVKRLVELQHWHGGFSWWRQGMEAWPYPSIHAMHALVRAKAAGFRVPAETLERGQRYLREIEQYIPGYYPIDVKRTLRAYALYVRERMGDHDARKAKELVREAGGADKLPLEAVGFLLHVLSGDGSATAEVEAMRRHLANRVEETAGAAHFTTDYSDGNYLLLHSNRRADGIILEALIEDQPKSDVIPKVVRGLLAHRRAGRWANTNESSFVLLALDRYFRTYENVTPDFVARAWLGDAYAGEHAFKGRTVDEHDIDVPMAWLAAKPGPEDLVLEKKGAGRLYYRIGMRYAPADLVLAPADRGFTVQRRYEAVDDPADVTRGPDGVWKIRAGARVRVRLTMVAPARRYHVALVDPLPAGLETMNPELAVTGAIPQDPHEQKQRYWWWSMPWYEHQNLRDERVEAFTTLLWEGVWNYSYVTRATTPGTFVVPPAKAEEMYSPETFGRSGTDRVVIE